jgi:hypothetical protein
MELFITVVVLAAVGGFIYWRSQQPKANGTGGSGKDTPPKNKS